MSASLPTGTVTFLFTDIEGSTRLLQQLGDKYAELLAEYEQLLLEACETHNGSVVDTQGDSFFFAFSRAVDAIHAMVQSQHALTTHRWTDGASVRVRMGLHTGEPQIGSSRYVGIDVHRAARIAAAAHGGQVLLSQTTYHLIENELPLGVTLRDLGEHRLKDLRRPEHLYQLVIAGLPSDFPPLKSLNVSPNNLPMQLTSFIGRSREIGEVKQLLSKERLLTLTGPGGSGKTRLALQVASEMIEHFRDGVFFVALAPITDPGLVASTIALSLGLTDTAAISIVASLKSYLQSKSLLLLLDNFEQIISAAPLVAELLAASSELKVLVTSREGLRISGEREYPVPPLVLPNLTQLPTLESLSQYAVVELFIQRAQAVKPDFHITTDTAPAVAEICYRLDGLPLAIELAAARIKLLPPQALLARLKHRLAFLTGGARDLPARQQTLRNTIDWSYNLLNESEARLFEQLSVFVGGCTIEVAEAVCGAGADLSLDVLTGLTSLVDKNLIVQEEALRGEPRFGMLETIREYAREKLETSGETETIRQRHFAYFLELAQKAESELKGAEQSEWIERLEREHDNLRAALAWSLENDTAVALQLAETLGQFWFMRGHHFGEGIEWLERVLSREEAPGQVASRAKAFRWLGTLTYFQGNYAAARSAYEQSLALSQEMQDMDNIAEAFFYLADTAASQGDAAAARNLYAQARSLALDNLTSLRKLGDKWNIARTLNTLGEMARVEGEYVAARKFYEESLLIRQELGDQRGIAVSLINLGFVAYDGGDYQQAAVFFEESLVLFQKHGGKRGVVDCLMGLAGVVGRAGQPERAARLLGSMEAVREAIRIGSAMSYADRLEYDRYESAVRAQLDETSFTAAWAEGRMMTLEQAVAYALLETETLSPVQSVKEIFGGLTTREREAAALIAQGMNNREIAKVMIVSVKTVETYVTRILNKLGIDSRVQIAIWAFEKGLVPPTHLPNG